MRIPVPKLDVKKYLPQDPSTARCAALVSVLILVLMAVSATAAFFLSLRGTEKTMVPDVRGMDLPNALISLQEKELYPRVQLRYSDSAAEAGKILEQSPSSGTIVKAGRRINLVVSRGVVLSKVENFIGQDLNEVKLHLQTLFTSSTRPLLSIKEPPMYVFDSSPAGTILAQKPLPDAPLSQPTLLELVVSRGPEKEKIIVPALLGMRVEEALQALAEAKAGFSFTSRKAVGAEKPYTVVSQLPAAGASIPSNTRLALVVAEPSKQGDAVFGILKQTLPEYPYPLTLSVSALLPSGDGMVLFEGPHSGGDFSIPYLLPHGSQIILSILGQEKFRVEVE